MLTHLNNNRRTLINKEQGRHEMKTTIQAVLFCICITSMNAIAESDNLNLEPCINGEVSASGLFPTQESEDRSHNMQLEAKRQISPNSRKAAPTFGHFDG